MAFSVPKRNVYTLPCCPCCSQAQATTNESIVPLPNLFAPAMHKGHRNSNNQGRDVCESNDIGMPSCQYPVGLLARHSPLNHLLSPIWTLQMYRLPLPTVAVRSWWRPPSLPSAVRVSSSYLQQQPSSALACYKLPGLCYIKPRASSLSLCVISPQAARCSNLLRYPTLTFENFMQIQHNLTYTSAWCCMS